MRIGAPANLHPGGNLERDAPYENHISVRTHDTKSWKFTVEDVKMLKEIVKPVFVTGTDEAGLSCCPCASGVKQREEMNSFRFDVQRRTRDAAAVG